MEETRLVVRSYYVFVLLLGAVLWIFGNAPMFWYAGGAFVGHGVVMAITQEWSEHKQP